MGPVSMFTARWFSIVRYQVITSLLANTAAAGASAIGVFWWPTNPPLRKTRVPVFMVKAAPSDNYGRLSVSNCTFSGNSVGGWGGAIHNDGLSQGTTIESCTLRANHAASGGGIFNRGAPPSMISPVHLRNTIVVGNIGLDIGHSSVIESGGYNLIGSIGDPYGNRDFRLFPGPGDQTNVTVWDVNLGPLQLNGSSTSTRALLRPSLAIDVDRKATFRPMIVSEGLRVPSARVATSAHSNWIQKARCRRSDNRRTHEWHSLHVRHDCPNRSPGTRPR